MFPCRGTPLRGQATCRLNSPLHRQRAGKVGNRPCRARTGLQASTATQADRMRSETPATPRSALTQSVTVIERIKVNVHAALQTKVSGQLPNLGSVCGWVAWVDLGRSARKERSLARERRVASHERRATLRCAPKRPAPPAHRYENRSNTTCRVCDRNASRRSRAGRMDRKSRRFRSGVRIRPLTSA